MPNDALDPADLDGDELTRWYQRSPWDIEQERKAAEARRHTAYFAQPTTASAGSVNDTSAVANPPLWSTGSVDADGVTSAFLDKSGAGADDGGELALIGNPANRRLRSEWELKWGQIWPKDPATGRNYDVAHHVAKADGGKDHVDNIRPMHPDDHIAEHIRNGDFRRWALRPGIARAFGGVVAHEGMSPLAVFSDLLGIASGRIRTDNFDNFSSDMQGIPSSGDRRKALEDEQRLINPNWKPGDDIVA